MMTIEHDRADYLVCRVSGKLTKGDYDAALPEIENAFRLRGGDAGLMIVMEDFAGWSLDAFWEELKFDLTRRKKFSKVAVVGESGLEEWGTRLSGLFSASEICFFDRDDRDAARAWLSKDTVEGSR